MFRPDDNLGPYKLIRRIGKGSFGVVWLAEKRSAIASTNVALKIPSDDTVDIDAVRHEASVWVSASGHPNVLPIIEADVYDEQVVIVSEYAPDGTLAEWIEHHGGLPPIDEATEMILGILAGLQHLHKRGIIHRDLKPENILLQGDIPRLADFGIARVLKATSNTAASSGTPFYMPPEAFDGKRSEHADIWSVGVIFYQLLAGRLPFGGDNMTALMGAIISKDPAPIPGCPPQIWPIIEKALEKDPDKRYATAGEMRSGLRQTVSRRSDGLTRPHDPALDISMQPTLRSAKVSTREVNDETIRLEQPTSPRTGPIIQTRSRSRLLKIAAAALATALLIGGGLYFYKPATGGLQHSEQQVSGVFVKKTDLWVDRIFSGQGQNGGTHEIAASEDTAQVWSTAQCLAAVLASGKDLTQYSDRIKTGFDFIEKARRDKPSPGWNYYGNANTFTVTEIGGWVVLAEIFAVDAKTLNLSPTERDQITARITRDLDEIIQRQDKNGGWRPIQEDKPGFIRTYSSAIALWSLIEARRSPAISQAVGAKYDDNIRRGVNWLLLNYKSGQGWVPGPNRLGQAGRFEGLNAQILFVLGRAETAEAFSYLKFEPAYIAAAKEFIANPDLATRQIDSGNSSVPDVDIRFAGSEFMAEGSTFLWFPWTLAELSQLASDEGLSQPDHTAAAELRAKILDHNYDRLDTYVESGGLMYIFAENLLCSSIYLRSLPEKSS